VITAGLTGGEFRRREHLFDEHGPDGSPFPLAVNSLPEHITRETVVNQDAVLVGALVNRDHIEAQMSVFARNEDFVELACPDAAIIRISGLKGAG